MKRIVFFVAIALIGSAPPAAAQNIDFVSSCLWAGAGDIEVRDSLAFCVYYNGLAVFNITDRSHPLMAGQYSLPSRTGRFSLAGDYAYVANRADGLRVIDVSNPANPVMAATFPTGDQCNDVAIDGQYAYVVDRDSFMIVNVANPGAPSRVSAIDIPKNANNIFVAGGYAYVTDDSCLHIVNVTNPAVPSVISSTPLGDYGQGVYVTGGCAYVVATDSGLKIFNIQNPANPLLVGTYGVGPWAWTVYVRDHYAYYGTGWGLRVYDVTRPDSAVEVFRFEDPNYSCSGIFVDSTHVYLGRGLMGFFIFDRDNLTGPIGEYLSPSHLTNIDINGPLVAGVNPYFGYFQIADFSDPAHPRRAAIMPQPSIKDVALSGGYAFLACGDSRLRVFNILDPENPQPVGQIDPQTNLEQVVIDSHYAYAVGSDPYVLLVLDIDVPSQPVVVGSRLLQGSTADICVDGNYAFLIENGVVAFDISNPYSIHRLGNYPQNGARHLCADGRYIFVACSWEGVVVFDAIDPYNLTPVCNFDSAGYATDVYKAGHRLYVSDTRDDAILAYDVSNPLDPIPLGSYPEPDAIEDIIAAGDDIYVSDYYSLTALRLNSVGVAPDDVLPESPSILSAFPNPFNAATTFTLQGSDEAQIEIYDINGRKVAGLKAYSGKAVWEARGQSSGIYFARAVGGDEKSNVIKLICLK